MASIGIFYGSTMGNTELAAVKIAELLGNAVVRSVNPGVFDEIPRYDVILLGSSTWGAGDLQDDWEPLLKRLRETNLNGKKIGFFGTGDQSSYPDTFADSLGILYGAIENSGAVFIGSWPCDGYDYSKSRAEKNGSFVGLVLDEDNQPDMTEERIRQWDDIIKSQL